MARCISSVKSIVSEIIIVDTGSTDNTIKIATELGAQVFPRPWDNDFAAPRNLSLEKARSSWILVLDADEAIAKEDLATLMTLTNDPKVCYEFLQRHYTNDQRLSGFKPKKGEYPEWEKYSGGFTESNCVRFFPNYAGLRFEGRVHELVEHSIWRLGKHKIKRTHIPIHHYGHLERGAEVRKKDTLYTQLGDQKIEDMPLDWKAHFERGVQYNCNGEYGQSIAAFRRSLALNSNYVPTWVNLGYVLCEAGQYREAREVLTTALKLKPSSEEAHCNLGVVYLRAGAPDLSAQHFARAVELNPNYINAYCNLGHALLRMGEVNEAVKALEKAIELFPSCTEARSSLGAIYLKLGRYDEAERNLVEALQQQPDLAPALFNLHQLQNIKKEMRE